MLGNGSHVTRLAKQVILSSPGTVYDPLGLISPIAVKAKVLFQDLCTMKIDWYDLVPEEKGKNGMNESIV